MMIVGSYKESLQNLKVVYRCLLISLSHDTFHWVQLKNITQHNESLLMHTYIGP